MPQLANTYLLLDGKQRGPFDEKAIAELLSDGTIDHETPAWKEGLPDWAQLGSVLPAQPSTHASLSPETVRPSQDSAPKASAVSIGASQVVAQGGQAALISGIVCCLAACGFMAVSIFSIYFYAPLFLAAFILSICAIAQGQAGGGLMLLAVVIGSPIVVMLSGNISSSTPTHSEAQMTGNVAGPATTPPLPAPSPYPALDAKMGFREFKLGAKETDIPASKLSQKTPLFAPTDEEDYEVVQDDSQGTLKLQAVKLTFKQNLLTKILVKTLGPDQSAELKEALTKAYGDPSESESSGLAGTAQTYEWKGQHCDLRFSLNQYGDGTAEFTSPDADAMVAARLTSIQDEKMRDQYEREQQAQKDAEANAKRL